MGRTICKKVDRRLRLQGSTLLVEWTNNTSRSNGVVTAWVSRVAVLTREREKELS